MDARVDLPETHYFFLGDGRLMSVVQWSGNEEATPLGLLLGHPERAVRKTAALTIHPELGLRRTMLTVVVDGRRFHPVHDTLTVDWDGDDCVVATWPAGTAIVRERFVCGEHGALHRHVEITAPEPGDVRIEAALYANPLFCSHFTAEAGRLEARGDAQLTVDAFPTGQAFERFLTIEPERHGPMLTATIRYALDQEELAPLRSSRDGRPDTHASANRAEPRNDAEQEIVTARAERIQRQFQLARRGLRAIVAHDGRFPASIWQYEFEWAMDASMVARAAALAGEHELAHEVLLNILTHLSTPEGALAEASRFRDDELAELNANGAVLDAIWHHWVLSGDDSLVRERWDRISAIAEYPLGREVRFETDATSDPTAPEAPGLLRGRRDFWERLPWHGVDDGFELGHQVLCAVGLQRAASLASALDRPAQSERWAAAAQRLCASILHADVGFIDNERFVHRRRADGSVQTAMQPDATWSPGAYAPYAPPNIDASVRPRRCDPDITSVLPIVYDLVDPLSPEASSTVDALEALWSPTGHGGYARYPLESDPDSPGPWPFATAFAAAAQIEAGLSERARRSIDWLLDAAGPGGSWLEYYGERTPPAPPVGVIPWGWAQFIILTIRHLLGVRLFDDHVVIRPRLAGLHVPIRIGRHRIDVAVEGLGAARLDGVPCGQSGTVTLPLPLTADHLLQFEPS